MLNILNHYIGSKILLRIEPEISHAIALCYLRLLNRLVKKKKKNYSCPKNKNLWDGVAFAYRFSGGF